jgi:glucose-6-phosphate isomerase
VSESGPLVAVGGGLKITVSPELAAATQSVREQLVADRVPAALAAGDASLWGPDAAAEAAQRLGWLRLAETSRPLVDPLRSLRKELLEDGIDRVVLAGMGGSSLAPEVICASAGVPLVTLDTTDPGQVAAALVDLARTVIVVSSKSGGTVETDSHHRAFRAAFTAAGLNAAQHIVIVTDPGSPLELKATDLGVRALFRADPNVGGRYSALTAFGLVPSALAGVDIEELLDDAAAVTATLADPDGPAVLLGAAIGAAALAGRDKLVLATADSPIVGLGDWVEQLVAESTGKQGRGILPVVVDSLDTPGGQGADRQPSVLGTDVPPSAGTAVNGPLGALFVAWEYATAIAGRILEIDPFDQPNVQESKDNTKALLDGASGGLLTEPEAERSFVDGPVSIYGSASVVGPAVTLTAALDGLLAQVPPGGYLAIMAYLDRLADKSAAELREAFAHRIPAAVTFGWGPRFLHSTGQYHKGGPAVGAFLQVTAEPDGDLAIPDQPFSFATLQRAQALGDQQALTGRARPFLRVHLADRATGLAALLAAARGTA